MRLLHFEQLANQVHSIKDLIDYAKTNPGKVSYVTAGANSSQHLGGLLIGITAHVDLVHVAYKGGGDQAAAGVDHQMQRLDWKDRVLPHSRPLSCLFFLARTRIEHDHRHTGESVRFHLYRNAATLLADFWGQVESILEKGGR